MAQFDIWNDSEWVLCPNPDEVWSKREGRCIPKRNVAPEGASFIGGGLGAALANVGDSIRDFKCQKGYMWDRTANNGKGGCVAISEWNTTAAGDDDGWTPTYDRPLEDKTPVWGMLTRKECDQSGGVWDGSACHPPGWTAEEPPPQKPPIVPGLDDGLIPETPPPLFGNITPILDGLSSWLTTSASDKTEQDYWDTKMKRLNSEWQRERDQKFEDLNVKGLYYGGMRDTALDDIDRQWRDIITEEEAKFQYERFDRDVQRYGMAMQYALGTKAQEIDWAYKRGTLTIQMLDLALQETLGVRALDIKEAGMMNDFIIGMYNVAISQETNQIARDQLWINTVNLLYQMGYTETEVQAMWVKLNGDTTGPPV